MGAELVTLTRQMVKGLGQSKVNFGKSPLKWEFEKLENKQKKAFEVLITAQLSAILSANKRTERDCKNKLTR